MGGFGGVQPAGPAVGRAENGAEREKKKELFRRALEGKKKGKKKEEKDGVREEDLREDPHRASGASPGNEGRLPGEGGHRVDVLA